MLLRLCLMHRRGRHRKRLHATETKTPASGVRKKQKNKNKGPAGTLFDSVLIVQIVSLFISSTLGSNQY